MQRPMQEPEEIRKYDTLRLVLGDQLNPLHSWFRETDGRILYVLMEIRTETDYAWHHIQKATAFFAAMERFARQIRSTGHDVKYFRLDDADNLQGFDSNCAALIKAHGITRFEYQQPDEYRVDALLEQFCKSLAIPVEMADSEHFYTKRNDVADFFEGKKMLLMENFYHDMRKKHDILMKGGVPEGGIWNFDVENRKKLPKNHVPPPPLFFSNDVSEAHARITKAGVYTIGTLNPKALPWPLDREQALELLDYFTQRGLPLFGTFQDAMDTLHWALYHSRLSFAMNTKMLSPREVIDAAVQAWRDDPHGIALNQIEGFVRQILGWREYMRGVYWMLMPGLETQNFFGHTRKLPDWYWTGKTKMNCLKHAIDASLEHAYAHHIQRLMITGNFALLAGIHPDETDQWYLGIYVDALQWVEITNTRGMSQYADGGKIATKPYTGSANYIHKSSNYCDKCHYDKSKRVGEKACPFNSLYWHFHDRHRDKLFHNPRIGFVYKLWDKMAGADRAATLEQAEVYLKDIENL